MSDENRILESLGKLSGLVEASREDIKTLVSKHDEQSKCIQTLATAVQVIQTGYGAREASCAKEFKDINEKLGRDYDKINTLEKKTIVSEGIDIYKEKKMSRWQMTLGIMGAIIGILIGINQLICISKQMTEIKSPSAVYASPLKSKPDTLTDSNRTFIVTTDTIKVKK